MEEPSVLDYFKSKLFPKKYESITLSDSDIKINVKPNSEVISPSALISFKLQWRLYLALILALFAQRQLDTETQSVTIPIILYVLSMIFLVWSIITNEINVSKGREEEQWTETIEFQKNPFYILIPLIIISFFTFSGNQFTAINLMLWFVVIYLIFRAFWLRPNNQDNKKPFSFRSVSIFPIKIKFTKWHLLVSVVIFIAAFYRLFQLDTIPAEMFSDHAEKLLDVADILAGNTSIFFPRNTGREAFQMYLTAFVSMIFNTRISFMSLKLGTAIAGILTLPYIYYLGKEIGNRYVGILALFFAGIAYWPNVISRVGLRFTLYPFFVAPTMYYFIRGLKKSRRNDFILSGIFLGLGLHGYSPSRLVPILLIVGMVLYLLTNRSNINRKKAINAFILLAFVSLVIFLPLLRYWTQNPDMFGYRALSRLGTTERAYPGSIIVIFLKNFWDAIIMCFWKNGNIWVHSVTNRPALDVVSAVFYFWGLVILFIRFIKNWNWIDIFLLFSIPILMLPSILSLAFPDENPSLNRTAGALVPVFLVTAIGFETFIRSLLNSSFSRVSKAIAIGTIALLISWMSIQNYDLIFNQYKNQFVNNAWNTSEIGEVIRGFSDSIGKKDSAYVIPYPHWVDTRLVGINAGFPEKDYALWPENFQQSVDVNPPKLFIIKPENKDALNQLIMMYPGGVLQTYTSETEGKDFYTYTVYK